MKEIGINTLTSQELYRLLTSTITPRPIAFVSSKDEEGVCNLSPFSFFNIFSVTPPIVVFSPVNRISDNTKKHTLHNVIKTKECVVALVNQRIVQQAVFLQEITKAVQMSLKKLVLQKFKHHQLIGNLIKEAPVNFECKVNQIVELGNKGEQEI